MKLEDLSQELQLNIVKTLLVTALHNNGGKIDLLPKYVKYGGEAFDNFVEISVKDDVITFTQKV